MKIFRSILVLLLFAITFPALAQNDVPEQREQFSGKFKSGLWQMMQAVPNEGGEGEHLIYLPVWKFYGGDGRYCSFLIASRDGASMQTMDGEYEVLSDSVFVEKVNRCITEPKWQGQHFTVKYFVDRQGVMFVEFPTADNNPPHREIWRYVDMSKPREVNQFRRPGPPHHHKHGGKPGEEPKK